ncbi:DUF5333 domain-containing protein [Paracoccus albicereus]|nr:DUF5333 domain-containing protein [Paracoccus albicereus]
MLSTALIAATLAAATPALALEPLSQERYINDRLIAARVADRIRRECSSIDARMIFAFTQARALKRYARDKGYSEDQIETFLDSKEDKQRIYGIAEDYLARKGATAGNEDGFCKLGRDEIAAGSVIGSLLSAK